MKPTGRLTVVAGLLMFVLTGCLSPGQSPIVSRFQALRPAGATIAGQAPLDDFGTVRFTDGSAVKDGKTLTMAGAGARPITMIDRAGRAIATPSSVGADGASFAVTRTASPASEPAPSRALGRRGGRLAAGGRPGSGG